MTEFLPRSAWTNDPKPSTAAMLQDAQVEGFAVHWPGGAGSIPNSETASIQLLDGELAYHTNPVSQGGKGWSDIAYQYAVDQAGRVWELRGVNRRSAANGDVDVNERFGAITCLVGPNNELTPALLQAVVDFRTKVWLSRFPHATKVVCHSDIRPTPTDCPGDALRAQVHGGTFIRPGSIVTQPTLEDSMRVVKIPDGRYFLTNGPFVSYIKTSPELLDWCRVTGQIAKDANNNDVPSNVPTVGAGTVAGVINTDTVMMIQTLANAAANSSAAAVVAAGQRPDVDEAALAQDLAPLFTAYFKDALPHMSDSDLQTIIQGIVNEQAKRLGNG